jgi:NAD-reducing hydrogenase small subunit
VTIRKPRIATTSLCGCFGCHMSLLDIDERLLKLVQLVEFDKSPLNDLKVFTEQCDLGLIEGGCANDDNYEILRAFRRNCKLLVSVGECARAGGIPALRNPLPLQECLEEAYLSGPTVHNPGRLIPNDPDIPLLLDRVYPCHEIVRIDYHLPGCPPSADSIWAALSALLSNQALELPYELLKYD